MQGNEGRRFGGLPLFQLVDCRAEKGAPIVALRALDLEPEMDRLNAIRLLLALIAAGKDSSAPMEKAWLTKKAWEIGLDRQQLVGALGYAGNEGWLTDGPREGYSLTTKGEAAARGQITTVRKTHFLRAAHGRASEKITTG